MAKEEKEEILLNGVDPDEITIYSGRPDCVLSGAMLFEGEILPLYVRPETGDVLYEDPQTGEGMCVGELSVTDPIRIPCAKGVTEAVISEFGGSKYGGRIYTESCEIIIDTNFSKYFQREYGEPVHEPIWHAMDKDIADALVM